MAPREGVFDGLGFIQDNRGERNVGEEFLVPFEGIVRDAIEDFLVLFDAFDGLFARFFVGVNHHARERGEFGYLAFPVIEHRFRGDDQNRLLLRERRDIAYGFKRFP